MALMWREERDGARWVGSREGTDVAWLDRQPEEHRAAWTAMARAGWLVECQTLERAIELMDGHALDGAYPESPRPVRRRFVRNRGPEWSPHPGTVPAPKRQG